MVNVDTGLKELRELYKWLMIGDMIYTNDGKAYGVVETYDLPVELMLKVKEFVRSEDGELQMQKGFKWIDLQEEYVNNNIKTISIGEGERIYA